MNPLVPGNALKNCRLSANSSFCWRRQSSLKLLYCRSKQIARMPILSGLFIVRAMNPATLILRT